MRECPGCGFKKAAHEIDRSFINFACPRCGKHAISEFREPIVEPVQEYQIDYDHWMPCYGGTE